MTTNTLKDHLNKVRLIMLIANSLAAIVFFTAYYHTMNIMLLIAGGINIVALIVFLFFMSWYQNKYPHLFAEDELPERHEKDE